MNHAVLKEKKRDGGYVDHPLNKSVVTLGRSKEADIVVNDSSVSRLHVRIENRNGTYLIIDNNSSNGTYVNKKKVSESPLADGDDIITGRVQFYFSHKAVEAHEEFMMGDTAETPRSQLAETIETPTIKPAAAMTDTPKIPQPMAPPPPSYQPPPPQAPTSYQAPPQAPPAYQPPPQAPAPPAPSMQPPQAPPPAPPQAPAMPPMPSFQSPPLPNFGGSAGADSAPASPIHRFLAFVIEIVIFMIAYAVIFVGAFFLPSWLLSILSLVLGLGSLAYFIVGWMKYGKTLGKHFLGIRIVEVEHPDKIGLDIKTVLMRWLGMIICALPLYLGFLTILFDPEGRGFHDKMAGTRVVKK
ncbi:MAG: RDD family protein [Acidobacteria bacterium]|nr:RDD family protein [Acidobacteriota bacterium]